MFVDSQVSVMQIMPTELSSAICWISSALVAIALTFADRKYWDIGIGILVKMIGHSVSVRLCSANRRSRF